MRVISLLLIALIGCYKPHPPEISYPKQVYQYNIPLVYEQWLLEAKVCVEYFRDSSYTLDSLNMKLSANDYRWLAVPSENSTGSFKFGTKRLYGAYFAADDNGSQRFYISTRHMMNPVIIKHEFMHALVIKSTELDDEHGMPWGLCELDYQ